MVNKRHLRHMLKGKKEFLYNKVRLAREKALENANKRRAAANLPTEKIKHNTGGKLMFWIVILILIAVAWYFFFR